jgi:hypothetical protein
MRASPPFQVSVTRFGVWRCAIVGLAIGAAATLAGWLATRDEFTPWAWQMAAGVAGAGLLLSSLALLRVAPLSLRWDGRQWHLGPVASAGDEPWEGSLAVALDLGGWLLLRFAHEAPARPRRFTWLPIQRRGLEDRWHALRCAVYCARPVAGSDAGTHPAAAQDSKNERP